MKKISLFIGLLVLSGGTLFVVMGGEAESPEAEVAAVEVVSAEPQAKSDQYQVVDAGVNQPQEVQVKLAHSIDEEDSIWLVVNKDRPISLEYEPVDLRAVEVVKREDKSAAELMMRTEAADALEAMFEAADKDELSLLMGSAYRTSELQNYYYTNYVAAYGQEEADKFSAKPGTSEHQTGLAADVSPSSRNCYLEICFAETVEGKWVAVHAHEYGFTIRYPEGKEDITGYQYEPWHLRYVGEELAFELYEDDQTLEEHFSL